LRVNIKEACSNADTSFYGTTGFDIMQIIFYNIRALIKFYYFGNGADKNG